MRTVQVLVRDECTQPLDGWHLASIVLCPTHGQALVLALSPELVAHLEAAGISMEERAARVKCAVQGFAEIMSGQFHIPVALAETVPPPPPSSPAAGAKSN